MNIVCKLCRCHWPLGRSPFFAKQQVPDDVHAEHVEVVSEKDVEQEQLTDRVDAVQQFDDDVGKRQIVAGHTSGHEDAVTRQKFASSWQTPSPVITTCHQIAVQQVHGESANDATCQCVR